MTKRPWWLAFVLLCVLGAQTLGAVHGFAHASVHPAQSNATARSLPSTPGKLEPVFAQHEDAEDCRLFDALGQQPGAAMAGPAHPPAMPPGIQQLRHLEGAFVARWAALFDARGPPLSH